MCRCHRGHRGKCHPGSNLLAQEQSGDTTCDVPVGRKVVALASLLCWLRAVTHEPESGVSLPGMFLSWIPANSLRQLIQHGCGSARSHSCHPGPVIPLQVGRSAGKSVPVPTRPRRARSEQSVILLQWERQRPDGFAGRCSQLECPEGSMDVGSWVGGLELGMGRRSTTFVLGGHWGTGKMP